VRDVLSETSYLTDACTEELRDDEPESILRTVVEIVEVVVSIFVEKPSLELFDIEAEAFKRSLSKNPFLALKDMS
jgi:hypothetical protein